MARFTDLLPLPVHRPPPPPRTCRGVLDDVSRGWLVLHALAATLLWLSMHLRGASHWAGVVNTAQAAVLRFIRGRKSAQEWPKAADFLGWRFLKSAAEDRNLAVPLLAHWSPVRHLAVGGRWCLRLVAGYFARWTELKELGHAE